MTLWAMFWLGAEVVSPGSVSYTSVGTFSFTVPNYNTMTVDCRGAGGGGSGAVVAPSSPSGYYQGTAGTGGGIGRFASSTAVIGNGASPGIVGSTQFIAPSGKDPGSAADTPGANGGNASGSGPSGVSLTTGGGAPGGVGGLAVGDVNNTDWRAAGGNGGAGGRAVMVFTKGNAGAPVPGTSITVTVQSGGIAGTNNDYSNGIGFTRIPTAGNPASVSVSWS